VFKEFKEFISRGNVIDLAVAVVIGAAFGRVINSMVDNFFTPLIGMLGAFDFSRWHWTVRDSTFGFGLIANALVAFLLVAVAIFFFVVKPMNVLAARRRRGEAPEPEEVSDEVALLTEIRDLLREGRSRTQVPTPRPDAGQGQGWGPPGQRQPPVR
jgi:large conductance mechanosensitive channel